MTAAVAAKNAVIEANRIAMMEQWKIRSWLEGQAIFKAQLEYLQDNKASPEEIEKLQQTAATQGFGAAIANAMILGQQLAAQAAAQQQALQNFLSMERDTSAADAWLAEQQEEQELQAGLMAYYLGRKEGEEQAQEQNQAEKPWWEKAWNWAFNYQRELSLGTGIIAGLVAVAIVATAAVTAPAWLIVGGAILVTAAIVTAGTLAINSHFGLDLGNNLVANLVVGTAATLITAGIGLLVTSLAPVISTTIASTCSHYATACSQIGTIIDVGEEALLSAQIAYYTWTGNQNGAAQAAIELQLEQMDGGAPGNTVAIELGEQIVKLGPDATKLIAKYGDDVIPLLIKHGDEGVSILQKYGGNGLKYLRLNKEDIPMGFDSITEYAEFGTNLQKGLFDAGVVCQELCKISSKLVAVAGIAIFLKLRLRMTA